MSQTSTLLADHGLVLSRLVRQDLLSPALLAAEPLVTPVHVHVFVGTELPPAQEAGPREAARKAAAGRRRADHLLENDMTRLRVVLDEDLQPDDDVGGGVSPYSPQPAAVGVSPEAPLDVNDVISTLIISAAVAIATLLPEVEDAFLDPGKHGGRGAEEEVTTSVQGDRKSVV